MRNKLSALAVAAATVTAATACSPRAGSDPDSTPAVGAASAAQHDAAVDHSAHVETRSGGDSAFAALQERGAREMGVDQYTSTHVFAPDPDGGRIMFQRDSADSTGIVRIREHLQQIAVAFGAGDFSIPGVVHARTVPGTEVMTAKRERIAYSYRPLPRGGEIIMRSADSAAVAAIHRFLAFQRRDHRADIRE